MLNFSDQTRLSEMEMQNVYSTMYSQAVTHPSTNMAQCCEAQGKGRAKGRPRKVTKRSFMDGGWWLVVYLSLMLYIKFG